MSRVVWYFQMHLRMLIFCACVGWSGVQRLIAGVQKERGEVLAVRMRKKTKRAVQKSPTQKILKRSFSRAVSSVSFRCTKYNRLGLGGISSLYDISIFFFISDTVWSNTVNNDVGYSSLIRAHLKKYLGRTQTELLRRKCIIQFFSKHVTSFIWRALKKKKTCVYIVAYNFSLKRLWQKGCVCRWQRRAV